MVRQIFPNISVKNLEKSKEFFTRLGFKFNPKFTDEKAACLIIENNIFVMLLTENFFKSFLPGKDISDTSKYSEIILGISVDSREQVNDILEKAISAGGKKFRETYDFGWMYGCTFEDLDGHIWEFIYMDESKMPDEMKNK